MQLPAALVPLRNKTFRRLWIATVIGWLGTWLQNTGAGWLMTTLAPQPFIVAMVQAATIMPIFLFALPGGAMADIIDRRIFLLSAQIWTIGAATLLAILTVLNLMTAMWLLALTFAIGIGSALINPAWNATVSELVPRDDLVQAVALNGIGFNLTRAVGPALAGFLILLGGASLAFSLYASALLVVVAALFTWRRERRFTGLPKEHLLSAMRTGLRFVRNTPAIRAAMVRNICYSVPASAPWALLPLFVRRDLGLGPGMYGVILGTMGIGGVTSGMLLPIVRARLSRNGTVILCTALSCTGMAILAIASHWFEAAFGMLVFGLGWTSAFATVQSSAQLVCPAWVRARALAIYQLAQNGALAFGSFTWGWTGNHIGIPDTFFSAAALGLVLIPLASRFSIEAMAPREPLAPTAAPAVPAPEAPAPEFVPLLRSARGEVMEMAYYRVEPPRRAEFMKLMHELHQVRRRNGAHAWQLYEDVAHPEGWVEVWSMESWTDHLREAIRLSAEDRALLATLAVFQHEAHRPTRYLAVDPEDYLHALEPRAPSADRLVVPGATRATPSRPLPS